MMSFRLASSAAGRRFFGSKPVFINRKNVSSALNPIVKKGDLKVPWLHESTVHKMQPSWFIVRYVH